MRSLVLGIIGATGLALASIATPAAASVTFNTSGSVLSCNGVANCVQNTSTSVSFGGMTLSYVEGSGLNIDPTSFINLGALDASGSGSFDLTGLLLGININQTDPGGSGMLQAGNLFGTIAGNSSSASISWLATGVTINGYIYSVSNSPLSIVPPASCIAGTEACGVTSIQGQVAAVPEPATWGMMLLGFAGMGMLLRRRRRPVLAQLA